MGMTKDKQKKQSEGPEETPEVPVESAESQEREESPNDIEAAQDDIETLKTQLEEAEAKVAENLDGWQRAQAEFINYKKRVERDREADYQYMKGDIIKKLLPVLDDLERALENRPEDAEWGNGVELIVRKFQSILETEGVTQVEAQGQPFDPNYHEAVSNEPSDEVESGHVIAVVQNGYTIGDKVIRPAVVRVAQ
jgi:molecular chaperone GrpE